MLNTDRKLHYPGMEPDDKVRRYVPPRRIVRAIAAENSGVLLKLQLQSFCHFNPDPCILAPGGEVILDFGIELHGQLALTFGDLHQQRLPLKVTFGESVSETLGTPTRNHAVHQFTLEPPNLGQFFLGNTAFRFVRLELAPDAPGPLPLLAAAAVAIYRDWEYKGFFQSDDARLNRIWEVGAYTVHLNCQDYIYDGVKRDRLVWMGDLYPEIRTLLSVFDEEELIRKSLDFVRDRTPDDKWMNTASSYSCWWIICQHDLHLAAAAGDEVLVVLDVVHAGEDVLVVAEELPVLGLGEHVLVGVHALLVHQVDVDEVVAHLVGGIAEHEDDLLGAGGDALEADGEAVPAQDGEDHAHGVVPEFGADVGGDLVHGGIVALGPGHHGLRHRHHVLVVELEARALGSGEHAVHHDLGDVISLPNDGSTDASGYSAD